MVGQIASFSVCTKVRGVMEHPWGVYGTPIEIRIKHPSEALFVIVLKTPTKELPKIPIFNSAKICENHNFSCLTFVVYSNGVYTYIALYIVTCTKTLVHSYNSCINVTVYAKTVPIGTTIEIHFMA